MVVACVSIAYNCGTGIVAPSTTLGAALHRRDWRAAERAFHLYVHAVNGQVLDGLVRRRDAEARVFAR